MKREQIIQIFKKHQVIKYPNVLPIDPYGVITQSDFIRIADEILALPLNVPSDDELEKTLWEEIAIPLSEKDRENNTDAYKQYKETFLWMRWVRDEIIKRNTL